MNRTTASNSNKVDRKGQSMKYEKKEEHIPNEEVFKE